MNRDSFLVLIVMSSRIKCVRVIRTHLHEGKPMYKTMLSWISPLALFTLSMPALAQEVSIIGSQAQNYCNRYADTRAKPSNAQRAQWISECMRLAQEQDACIRSNEPAAGGRSTPAQEQCIRTFRAKLDSLPKGTSRPIVTPG